MLPIFQYRIPLKQFEKTHIERPLNRLASANSDSLRAAQQLFAQLIAAENQEISIEYAIEIFTQLNPPQRIQLLREVQLHLTQERYPCLAFENNGRFFAYVLDRLEEAMIRTEEAAHAGVLGWLSSLRAKVQEKLAHGSPEHIAEVTKLIGKIRHAAQNVSVESREPHLSDAMLSFLGELTDNELGRIISFVTEIRNIRACRNRFHEVADEKYLEEVLGIKEYDLLGFGLPNPMKDFHAYLREDLDLVREIVAMDFVELTFLIDYISNFRSEKYQQGRTRE